jgi:hypothetical protein
MVMIVISKNFVFINYNVSWQKTADYQKTNRSYKITRNYFLFKKKINSRDMSCYITFLKKL